MTPREKRTRADASESPEEISTTKIEETSWKR